MVGGGPGCVFSQSRASVLGEVHCGCSVSDDSGSSDGVAHVDATVWLVGARQEQLNIPAMLALVCVIETE